MTSRAYSENKVNLILSKPCYNLKFHSASLPFKHTANSCGHSLVSATTARIQCGTEPHFLLTNYIQQLFFLCMIEPWIQGSPISTDSVGQSTLFALLCFVGTEVVKMVVDLPRHHNNNRVGIGFRRPVSCNQPAGSLLQLSSYFSESLPGTSEFFGDRF